MSAGKTVLVLCPNGKRQKVKAALGSSVLQILEECCQKQGFLSNDYDLRHQRTILDVTALVRFTNLPNNANLEMVQRSQPRKASQVVIALQLESGERLMDSFTSDTTLFDVISHFGKQHKSINLAREKPVCIYMSREVIGIQGLQSTKLLDIGIVGANAVIRLIHREAKPNEDSAMSLKNTSETSPTNIEHMDVVSPKNDLVQPRHNAADGNQTKKPDTSLTQTPTETSELVSTLPEALSSSLESREAPEGKRPKLSDEDMAATQESTSLSTPFKFPERSFKEHESKMEAIDPVMLKKEMKLSMPCDRHAVFFNTRDSDFLEDKTLPEDPPDTFFDVTVEDVRLMLHGLQSARQQMENAALMTSSMRKAQEIEKLQSHDKVVLRFYFPNGIALQGTFRPLETVGMAREYVCEHVGDGRAASVYLYTTPPKKILKDYTKTLAEIGLLNAAIVYVGTQGEPGDLLREEFSRFTVSRKEADMAVHNELNKKSGHITQVETSPSDDVSSTSSRTSESGRATKQNNNISTGQSKGKVPKWLQAGKNKSRPAQNETSHMVSGTLEPPSTDIDPSQTSSSNEGSERPTTQNGSSGDHSGGKVPKWFKAGR